MLDKMLEDALSRRNLVFLMNYICLLRAKISNENPGGGSGTFLAYNGGHPEKLVFGTYEDLEDILKAAFGMHEDFKKALM